MNRRIAFGRRTTQKQGLAWAVDNFVKKFGLWYLFLVFKFYIWLLKYALHMKKFNLIKGLCFGRQMTKCFCPGR